jgi:serine/threonine protein kinase
MEIPKVFGERFTVVEQLVKRPNCIVYRGTDSKLGDHEVAIKVYLDQPGGNEDWINQFNDDVARMRSASHQSLVPIIAGGCQDDWFYIVMELLSGGSLRDLLKSQGGPLSIDVAVTIIGELAAGLKDLHENHIWHGHIDSRAVLFKGDNVRLAGYYPRIISVIQKSKSMDGRMIVEPEYIAPEQLTGGTMDHRIDIFALAVLLFEMVTGQRPYVGDNPLQTAMQRLSKEPPVPAKINPAISPLLDAAIMKGLARDPNERYSTATAFVEAITGGRKQPKNPLAELEGGDEQNMVANQTIGVSMSTDAIRGILNAHEKAISEASSPQEPGGNVNEDTGVLETIVGKPAYAAELAARGITSGNTSSSAQAAGMAQGGACASLIALGGDLRGKRFQLAKSQNMIGSDRANDICIIGKGIPARYAIITEKNGQYFVGPLSPGGITVNDKKSESAEDVLLKRGDTISVGSSKLRFVEPKEVFTLQDDVADRVIDRTQSKIPKILGISACAAVVVCLVLFVAYSTTKTEKTVDLRQQEVKEAQEKKALIVRLRNEGDQLFKAGALIEPPDANAKKRFEQILEVDPDEAYAKRRLREIEDRVRAIVAQTEQKEKMVRQIETLLAEGDRHLLAKNYISPPGGNAKESYQAVLRIDPDNDRAKEKSAEINKLLGDMVGQINGFVERAKAYQKQGQFVAPPGENAYELLNQVLQIDPGNIEAKGIIYAMAAQSLVLGDQAKSAADVRQMRKAYLTAQALGVDPEFIRPRMKGTELIQKSRSSVIFVDRQGKEEEKRLADSRYLDTAEVKRRMAEFEIPVSVAGQEKGRRFVDVDSIE